jgi:hypothetical protein
MDLRRFSLMFGSAFDIFNNIPALGITHLIYLGFTNLFSQG